MIDPSSRIDQIFGINLKKVYKSISAASVRQVSSDQINISEFSALVEKTRAKIQEMPSIRVEKVVQAKTEFMAGKIKSADVIASKMISSSIDARECKE